MAAALLCSVGVAAAEVIVKPTSGGLVPVAEIVGTHPLTVELAEKRLVVVYPRYWEVPRGANPPDATAEITIRFDPGRLRSGVRPEQLALLGYDAGSKDWERLEITGRTDETLSALYASRFSILVLGAASPGDDRPPTVTGLRRVDVAPPR